MIFPSFCKRPTIYQQEHSNLLGTHAFVPLLQKLLKLLREASYSSRKALSKKSYPGTDCNCRIFIFQDFTDCSVHLAAVCFIGHLSIKYQLKDYLILDETLQFQSFLRKPNIFIGILDYPNPKYLTVTIAYSNKLDITKP